jgi:hypothetical protein
MLTVIQYAWLVHGKPIVTYILSVFFGLLSLIIIYAQVANVFDFKHNIIYDFVSAFDYKMGSSDYFYFFNVLR